MKLYFCSRVSINVNKSGPSAIQFRIVQCILQVKPWMLIWNTKVNKLLLVHPSTVLLVYHIFFKSVNVMMIVWIVKTLKIHVTCCWNFLYIKHGLIFAQLFSSNLCLSYILIKHLLPCQFHYWLFRVFSCHEMKVW